MKSMGSRIQFCACLLAIAALSHVAAAADSSRTLENLLEDFRSQGARLLYSSALVTPEMRAEVEPSGVSVEERLRSALRPHGLVPVPGPNGMLLVVRTPPATEPAAIVSHVKVLSDKIEDVSSMNAWLKSFIKPGMTEEQKALAVWNSVVKFRHQDAPPMEFLSGEGGDVHDAIKTFNVYGYGMCCCASSNIEELGRYAGFSARGWALNGHSVPELKFDNEWRLLDASLINWSRKADGKIAGVEDIIAGVTDWYENNPSFRKDTDKLLHFMRGGGWKKGPAVLATSKFYDENGWLPAATHGWYSTMSEFDGTTAEEKEKAFTYEYGYSQGYEVNIELRPGERITRNWFNKGLHVNMDLPNRTPGSLTNKVGENDMRYTPAYGDLAPGRIGNGTIEYEVPLANGAFRGSALNVDNLACASDDHISPALHVKDSANPGVLILRMPSSYVYLGGELNFKAAVGDGGQVDLAISLNNGLDWTEITKVNTSVEQRVELKPLIFRRYDYRLRFTFKGAGTGLESLKIVEDVQHSQRALPALNKGRNTISFSAGLPEGTITTEGCTNPAEKHQLTYADFHPTVVSLTDPGLLVVGHKGSITFPITTPGEMTRIRFGGHYRARDDKDHDGWDMQVSFDDGKTFKTVDRSVGPTGHGLCKYVTFSEIPSGTHNALVRWSGIQRNTTMLMSFRIDADYTQSHGGFAPVKITYQWEENGQPKQNVHIARDANESYTIDCLDKPVMKSIILELAD
jgi:hypothetical protein